MQTRTKRYRARQRAKAAAPPQALWGWGHGSVRKSDWALVRGAIKHGWPIPEHVRLAIMRGVHEVFDERGQLRDDRDVRWVFAAVRLCLSAERHNQSQELLRASGDQLRIE